MATVYPVEQEYTDGEDAVAEALDITAIMQAESLLELLTDDQLNRIGSRCFEGFESDLRSRKTGDDGDCWEDRYKRYLNIAMQVREPKTFPWPKASNVKLPLLCTASLQFQARAYPVIIDGSNLVKGRVLGNDNGVPEIGLDGQPVMQQMGPDTQPEPVWKVPPGAKRDRADRIGEHMSWQLLFGMPGWEEDTDRLLLQLPIVGSVFRKTYYDPIQKRNESKTVTALDFVINYWATSIEAAPRYTHVMRLYPYEVEERMRSGLWRTITLPTVQDQNDDSETAPIEFLEQFCRIDMDEDGYPEPYVVTFCRETQQVVRIVPCFDEDSVTMNLQTGQVVSIEARQYFTQYGFVPSPDGSFYYTGFGALLDDITASIDAATNQLLDAGTLANTQGGFVGSGINIRSGDFRFRAGEWKRVDVTGGTLRDNIVPLNLPGPSAVLFSLLEMLISFAKEITSIQDILTGASQGVNTPATTTLAQIEQATKLMTGIFKRIHRSFWNELKILFRLNKDYLDEEAYYALTDTPGQIGRADYQDEDLDVMPVSDPTMVNDALKAVRAQALLQFLNDPLVNQVEIRRRFFEGTGQNNIQELLNVPAPQPDPKMLIDAAKLEDDRDKTKSEIRKNNAASGASLVQAAQAAQGMGLLNDAAILAGAGVRLATDAADMEDSGEPIDGTGAAGGMEGPAPDAGIPALPEGAPGAIDGGMGLGGAGGPGMPN